MKATPALRKWVSDRMEEHGWNAAMLSDASRISHATWSRLFSRRQRYLGPATVAALCRIFHVSELDLYRIAHELDDPQANALADWLQAQDDKTRATVFRSATRQGWQPGSNHSRKSLETNAR